MNKLYSFVLYPDWSWSKVIVALWERCGSILPRAMGEQ